MAQTPTTRTPDTAVNSHTPESEQTSRSLAAFLRRVFGWQIVRFGVVSVIATTIDYLVLAALLAVLPTGSLFDSLAIAAGYLVGTVVNYAIARRYIFRPSHLPANLEFTLVVVIQIIGLGLTEGITLYCHHTFGWHLLVTKTVAVVAVFFWNYLARRWFVYRTSAGNPVSISVDETRNASHLALLGSILVLWVMLGAFFQICLQQTFHQFTYTLDDAYIHMSMAKHVVQDGVWGVTRHAFAPASSSNLWTLLLSGIYAVIGVHTWVPLVLNALFGTLILHGIYLALRPYRLPAGILFGALLAVLLLTPIPTLAFTGMEHLLHAWLVVLFFALFIPYLMPGDNPPPWWVIVGVFALVSLLVLARYESLFVIGVACLLLLWRKRWLPAGGMLGLALLAVAIPGYLYWQHGGFWLPNSVLMKGMRPDVTSWNALVIFLQSGAVRLAGTPHMLWLLMTGIFSVVALRTLPHSLERSRLSAASTMLGLVLCAHFLLSQEGAFTRYVGYLAAMGVVVLAPIAYALTRAHLSTPVRGGGQLWRQMILLMAVVSLLVGIRHAVLYLHLIPIASQNIYQQQVQMAHFLQRYYPRSTVVANDIGAITYYTDIQCIDVWGLADTAITRKKLANRFTAADLAAMAGAQGAEIALVYDSYFAHLIPKAWIPVGQWTILNNVACGSETVSFYAMDSASAQHLTRQLKEFAQELPPGVVVSGVEFSERIGYVTRRKATETDSFPVTVPTGMRQGE
jgi:putative flippase GtrA